MGLMGAVRNLLGIKGADGTNIASPTNPVPTQLNGSTVEQVGAAGALRAVLVGALAESLAPGMEETVSFERTGPLAAGTAETVYETTSACSLESLSLGADYPGTELRFNPRLANGNYDYVGMRLVDPTGTGRHPIAPLRLHNIGGENDYWREFSYNEDANEYAFGMKRSATFGNGVRIQVRNANDTEHNVAVVGLILKYKTLGGGQ